MLFLKPENVIEKKMDNSLVIQRKTVFLQSVYYHSVKVRFIVVNILFCAD